MQKKIIALALAAAAGSAFAQTNVTVYGVADLGQAWVKSSGAANNGVNQPTVGRLDSNSSYIGFKGTEDLGNGLKALFQFETSFAADKGYLSSGATTGRDSFVGLTGGFGTVVGGNLTAPFRAFGAKVELLPAAAGFGTTAAVTGQVATRLGTVETGADNRSQNAIAYVSPSFSGFSGTVAYVNGETRTNSVGNTAGYNSKQFQIAGQYDNGPLFVGAGYHKSYDAAFGLTGAPATTLAAVNNQDARVYRIAAVYTLPTATKLTALYDNTKVEGIPGVGGTGSIKRSAWSIGAAQSFGKNTVGLEYARSGDIKTTGLNHNDGDTGVKILTAVYSYELSKRTSVHARYSRLTNDQGVSSNYYWGNNPVSNNGATSGAGADYTGYMVGLRHAF